MRALGSSSSTSTVRLTCTLYWSTLSTIVMAGAVSYKHTLGIDLSVAFLENDKAMDDKRLEHPERGPVTIVTASCDRIDRLAPIDVSQDLSFVGKPNIDV